MRSSETELINELIEHYIKVLDNDLYHALETVGITSARKLTIEELKQVISDDDLTIEQLILPSEFSENGIKNRKMLRIGRGKTTVFFKEMSKIL